MNTGPPITTAAEAVTPTANPASLAVRAPDVQAAVTILGRWRNRLGKPPPVLDLHNADLQGAILVGAELQGVILVGAQLQDANLAGAQLQDARLNGAQLQRAILFGAQLQDAILFGAQLQDAILDTAELQGARASEATRWPEGWGSRSR